MKVVIDIPPSLYERAQEALGANKYRSIAQLASVALENQLLLEADETPLERSDGNKTQSDERRQASPRRDDATRGFAQLAVPAIPDGTAIPILDTTGVARRDVTKSG